MSIEESWVDNGEIDLIIEGMKTHRMNDIIKYICKCDNGSIACQMTDLIKNITLIF